jgi:hypothetical protein
MTYDFPLPRFFRITFIEDDVKSEDLADFMFGFGKLESFLIFLSARLPFAVFGVFSLLRAVKDGDLLLL